MKVRIAILIYLASLATFYCIYKIDAFIFAGKTSHGIFAVPAYLIIGIFLNRKVLRNIITYNPYSSSIFTTALSKIIAWLFWIIYYPFILVPLAIIRAL